MYVSDVYGSNPSRHLIGHVKGAWQDRLRVIHEAAGALAPERRRRRRGVWCTTKPLSGHTPSLLRFACFAAINGDLVTFRNHFCSSRSERSTCTNCERMSCDCPRFHHCNAPICPMEDWTRRHHLKGEAVCFYLREAAKHGGALPLTGDMPAELAGKVSEAYHEIISSPCSRWGDVRRRLARAALSRSKSCAALGSLLMESA